MSPRRSTVPDDRRSIREAASRQRRAEPYASDPALAAVLQAAVGTPALVRSPEGHPAFWIVPFVEGLSACGFARVELGGRVSQLGSFGAGPLDRGAWPRAEFFEKPPPTSIEEIRQRHPHSTFGEPMLSYDRSPARWGWRIELGGDVGTAFIATGGWNVRRTA